MIKQNYLFWFLMLFILFSCSSNVEQGSSQNQNRALWGVWGHVALSIEGGDPITLYCPLILSVGATDFQEMRYYNDACESLDRTIGTYVFENSLITFQETDGPSYTSTVISLTDNEMVTQNIDSYSDEVMEHTWEKLDDI
ncbi:lipocalin family protein [Mangrovimonas sp. ST2L15]|uniref:lipocalin family protein n=1 Tax=Mangrovimonas sp. ST2L15 TaxID=1645916 RepID=UPI0009E94AD7|nr:lipocalin family protein [Mangrovimonas sp. ST2L15]